MAGGKLTPRQKMINLMYLVFIAMLALNMSKEVLSAFGLMNEKLEESNQTAQMSNASMLAALDQKAAEGDMQFKVAADKAHKVEVITKNFYEFVEQIKADLTSKVKVDEKTGKLPYEQMDKGDYLDEKWFNPEGISPAGKEVMATIEKYKSDLKAILSDDPKKFGSIINDLEKKFNLSKVKNKDGIEIEYLDYHFKGFPSVASMLKFSAWQNDVKKIETDIYNSLLGKAALQAASYSNFQAIVVLEKNAYFSGEAVKGKVVLGKYDENVKVKDFKGPGKLENGQAVISMTAGGVGEQSIAGSFTFTEDGKDIPIPFKGTYVVVPRPNSATISADKMNVVYRGLENPMTISFAGVPDSKVKASAAGLRQVSGGKYIIKPESGNEVVINVNATLDDGKPVSDKKVFRIKNVPPPTGFVRGEDDVVKGPASSLEKSVVTASPKDFDFDVKFSVVSFTIKVPGQPTVQVNGGNMSPAAIAAIKKAQRGDQISIANILARMEGSALTLKASPVIYEVQ
ncbi:MAG: gliding motility protein GldM [Flavobacteriales bacterium]|nr:gliding motility protein GldM [Flavobacteriales bacterium]